MPSDPSVSAELDPSAHGALVDDPLWFKDAVIYEIHIRAFSDSNGDGIGDIPGLIEKLDYLADLGVTAIWILPFYPSPLKDGGYDIADYTSVHAHYGTREDVARLLDEAHKRGIRVITELVLNHTSSEHPWFQRARRAPAGSPERDFYVWSDTPAKYEDTRIIFKDYETSNWAWDPVAKAYYWHRFYSHQPDLNFDNPAVHEALYSVIDYWLDLGVDGVRLDAVPYLFEREGTSCENLPETHAYLKQLRAHIDSKFKNRMLLAEANQWPADAAAYFGDGDECHMNFHFPLMPRMFMAIELEDSFPIINILRRTPAIPETTQWATFLRNHDELTLEMVTDEDRDTMYRAYAAERTARINLGIRRRLAPLLKVRRKIELMKGLLLSLPGTPVLYYGDEIGMGDNIYLGDRDGVRTPMQWSGDRNGGFSRANPQKLFLPTIIDPEYHYEAINVEAQQANLSSLLWWTKRLIAKRKEHKVFGRGSIEFMSCDNSHVLAFVREYEGVAVLVIANLSRFVQCARIELGKHAGRIPTELFSRNRFPEITEAPYFVSLGPHDFYWLALEKHAEEADGDRPVLPATGTWTSILAPANRPALAKVLVRHALQRRWFRGKAKARKAASITDIIPLPDARYAVALLTVEYVQSAPETYVIPLAFAEDAEPAEAGRSSAGIIAAVQLTGATGRGEQPVTGVIYDALCAYAFTSALLEAMRGKARIGGSKGSLAGEALTVLAELPPDVALPPRVSMVDQSNSGVAFGDRFHMKLFRVLEEGPNAEAEVGRFLTQHVPPRTGDEDRRLVVPHLAGVLEYRAGSREAGTIGVLMELVPNQGDAWALAMDSLARYFDRLLADPNRPEAPPLGELTLLQRARLPVEPTVVDWIGPFVDRVRLLGKRTGELHKVLASAPQEPLFTPQPFDIMHQQSIYGSVSASLSRIYDQLRAKRATLSPEAQTLVDELMSYESKMDAALAGITKKRIDVQRIRVHGDYHLGQVLWTGDDFAIIDFEGEPGRPLDQRRWKRTPLRDIAGMLRSLSYASAAGLRDGRIRPEDAIKLEPWARAWSEWTSAAFLAGYFQEVAGTKLVPANDTELQLLLEFFLVEKCVYEIGYELNSRPEWLEIPLRGLRDLARALV